jgi:hypothetical protein
LSGSALTSGFGGPEERPEVDPLLRDVATALEKFESFAPDHVVVIE